MERAEWWLQDGRCVLPTDASPGAGRKMETPWAEDCRGLEVRALCYPRPMTTRDAVVVSPPCHDLRHMLPARTHAHAAGPAIPESERQKDNSTPGMFRLKKRHDCGGARLSDMGVSHEPSEGAKEH